MKNFWASSAMGLGIALIVVGLNFAMYIPFLGMILGCIPIALGLKGLKKFKESPDAGGKTKSLIGIGLGLLLSLISIGFALYYKFL
jgi:hypothetical protein